MSERRYKLYAHHMQDVGCYLLTGFEAGVTYLIKGRVYEVRHYTETGKLWVEVSDLADVGIRANVVDVPTHWVDPDGLTHSNAAYYELRKGYQQKAFEDGDEDNRVVVDREAYELYKQVKTWTCVSETRKMVCDSSLLDFEVIPDQFLSGSIFITNFRPLEAQAEARVWRYDRLGAVTNEILATFKRLGTEHTGNESCSPRVNDGNSWGNSTHSGWRYLKAWGTYVFEEKHDGLVRDKAREEVGTLDAMQQCEANDRQKIRLRMEHVFRAKHLKHSLSGSSLHEVTSTLTSLIAKAKGLSTMQKSKTSRHEMIRCLEELQAKLVAGAAL